MTPRGVVVAAAIFESGRLLAAQRRRPPDLAGRWELPGGKVEPGETEEAALVRECREELGVLVRPVRPLHGAWPLAGALSATHVLRVWIADISAGVPCAGVDHLDVRWVGPDDWAALPWLDSDRPILRVLADHSEG